LNEQNYSKAVTDKAKVMLFQAYDATVLGLQQRKPNHQPTLYALKLCNEKYYVGVTSHLQRRYEQHLKGQGPTWTRLYPPIGFERLTIRNSDNPFEEDTMTKELMLKYGIDNVRGGSYSNSKLSDAQLEILNTEIRTATGACYHCSSTDHYANHCPNCSSEVKSTTRVSMPATSIGTCSHFERPYVASTCSAKQHSDGQLSFNERNGSELPAFGMSEAVVIVQEPKRIVIMCYRCGRLGHFSPSCYAKKHIVSGRYLDEWG
jgi:predicted GIY-YIG superfamily endonuclease